MRKFLPGLVAIFVIWTLAAGNFYASQQYSELLYPIVGLHDITHVKKFLAYIENAPEYPQQYAYFNTQLNNTLVQEDIEAQFSINSEIKRYQQILGRNSENPNLLTKLALLFLDKGDEVQAKSLYAQAKSLDPWLSVEELEELK